MILASHAGEVHVPQKHTHSPGRGSTDIPGRSVMEHSIALRTIDLVLLECCLLLATFLSLNPCTCSGNQTMR